MTARRTEVLGNTCGAQFGPASALRLCVLAKGHAGRHVVGATQWAQPGAHLTDQEKRSAYHRELVLAARAQHALETLERYRSALYGGNPPPPDGWLAVAMDALRVNAAEHGARADMLHREVMR